MNLPNPPSDIDYQIAEEERLLSEKLARLMLRIIASDQSNQEAKRLAREVYTKEMEKLNDSQTHE